MRIFINGTLDAATTPATAANTPRATTAPVLIGGDSSTHRFSGTLDDVSIYDRALSDSEIADLANIVDRRYQYHHLNALGSNIVLTDDNQKVLVRYEYDVFGAIRSETGTSDNTRKFTGKKFDTDSNLYYYAARYYDPYIGRFTQRDPIGDGVNWYAYTDNNPLKFIDPTGLQTEAPRPLSPLEAEAINFMFQGSINPNDLTIQIVHNLFGGGYAGSYSSVNKQIKIDSKYYEGMGLHANSTTSGDLVLSHDVITYLSILIHEATHHWQAEYGGWTKPKIGAAGKNLYRFDFDELSSLNLGNEQFASAVSNAFILKWQLDHGTEMVALRFRSFGRWVYNDNPNNDGRPGPSSAKVNGGWGPRVNRTVAGSLLWFFKPLMAHIGS